MWIMPGKAGDQQVGLMICGEYFKWGWHVTWDSLGFENTSNNYFVYSIWNARMDIKTIKSQLPDAGVMKMLRHGKSSLLENGKI